MADETDNILITTADGTALIGSDIFTNDGATAQAQIFKTSWGDDNYTYKVNTNTPLPVRIYGSTGDPNRTVVTGGVFGLGSFTVQNTYSTPLYVNGGTGGPIGVCGAVQGITNGIPLAVTGSVRILGDIGITGTVAVTGGRGLSHATDSVRVFGVIGTTRGWNLNATDDVVKVSPAQGGLTHSTYIVSAGGTVLGSSGDALKVHVTNAGITIDATLSPIVWIKNATGDILRMQGTTWISETNPTPVVIRGTKAYAKSNAGINSGDMVVTFEGTQPVQVINSPTVDIAATSNMYKYLHGASGSGNTASIGVNIASMQTAVNTINNKLNTSIPVKVRNDTAQTTSMKNWFVTLAANDTAGKLIANPNDLNLVPIQGTHIKNLTYLRSTNDPPPVTIGIGTRTAGATGGFNFSLYLDPGESVFLPVSVSGIYAKIIEKSVDSGYANQTYTNALGIMSI
jgi:hypothetical protein